MPQTPPRGGRTLGFRDHTAPRLRRIVQKSGMGNAFLTLCAPGWTQGDICILSSDQAPFHRSRPRHHPHAGGVPAFALRLPQMIRHERITAARTTVRASPNHIRMTCPGQEIRAGPAHAPTPGTVARPSGARQRPHGISGSPLPSTQQAAVSRPPPEA